MLVLAQKFGISEDTFRRRRDRENTTDGSHTAHNPNTRLTTAHEGAVMATLRRRIWLPMDEPLVVSRGFVHDKACRSAVNRLLQHRVSSCIPARAKRQHRFKPFKACDYNGGLNC